MESAATPEPFEEMPTAPAGTDTQLDEGTTLKQTPEAPAKPKVHSQWGRRNQYPQSSQPPKPRSPVPLNIPRDGSDRPAGLTIITPETKPSTFSNEDKYADSSNPGSTGLTQKDGGWTVQQITGGSSFGEHEGFTDEEIADIGSKLNVID